MDSEYVNAYLIETSSGPQGIVWADDEPQAEAMAIAEMDDADIDSTTMTVRPLPNHNLLFGVEA
jgi:hypothetical protein